MSESWSGDRVSVPCVGDARHDTNT